MGKISAFRKVKRLPGGWQKHVKRRQWPALSGVLAAAATGGLLMHLAMSNPTVSEFLKSTTPAAAIAAAGEAFGLCGLTFANDCVVDGDTIQYKGQRIRMIDYDTPEISEPKCASEEALGHRAKLRLLQLLNSGKVEVRKAGSRDEDRYGRKLRLVLVNGRSVGDTLIREGLAWPWQGRRHRWCGY